MRIEPRAFETEPATVIRWAASRGGHPALDEAGGSPEAPDLIFGGDRRSGTVDEVDWPEFIAAMKRAHLGLLHGGDIETFLFVREDVLPLPGLPDLRG